MADVGTGSTLVFGTVAIALTYTNIDHSGISRESIDVTNLASTNAKEFIPSRLYDGGEVTCEGLLDPDLGDALITKIGAASETITLTLPIPTGGLGGATMSFNGYLQDFEYGVPMEEEMTFSITLKVNGAITFTDST